MDILIAYAIVGYFWSIMCVNRTLELYPRKDWFNYIIGCALNSLFWPISMVMGYRLEKKLRERRVNRWIT